MYALWYLISKILIFSLVPLTAGYIQASFQKCSCTFCAMASVVNSFHFLLLKRVLITFLSRNRFCEVSTTLHAPGCFNCLQQTTRLRVLQLRFIDSRVHFFRRTASRKGLLGYRNVAKAPMILGVLEAKAVMKSSNYTFMISDFWGSRHQFDKCSCFGSA